MRGVGYLGWVPTVFLLTAVSTVACGGSEKPPETPGVPAATVKGSAAPATPAQEKAVTKAAEENQGGGLSISADVLRLCPGIKPPKFGYDSSSVKDEWRAAIQSLGDCMNNGGLKGKRILLTGHTDPRGDEDYNIQLGGRRAEAVKSALTSFGVQGGRIEVTSRGEVDAKGTEEASWAQDRRVDIGLHPDG